MTDYFLTFEARSPLVRGGSCMGVHIMSSCTYDKTVQARIEGQAIICSLTLVTDQSTSSASWVLALRATHTLASIGAEYVAIHAGKR